MGEATNTILPVQLRTDYKGLFEVILKDLSASEEQMMLDIVAASGCLREKRISAIGLVGSSGISPTASLDQFGRQLSILLPPVDFCASDQRSGSSASKKQFKLCPFHFIV